jgi:hypothetical protein
MDQNDINIAMVTGNVSPLADGKYYFANLRMTFRQNFFPQEWFRNKFGIGLG